MAIKQRLESIYSKIVPFIIKVISKFHLNRRVLTFGLFVAVSAVLWLLNTLSLNYNTTLKLKYKLAANNNSEMYLTGKESSGEISLRVNAPGFSLLQYNLFYQNTPWEVDISNMSDDQFHPFARNGFYLMPSAITQELKQLMPSNFHILDVEPDSIYFTVGIYSKRKIPVKAVLDISTGYQFRQTNLVEIKPDSVSVWGPSQLIDTMKYIYTQKITAKNISATTKYVASLNTSDQISVNQNTAEVTVHVNEYTEYNCISLIKFHNQKPGENTLLIPSSAKISCWVPINLYQKIIPSDFELFVDFDKLTSNSGKLKVEIARQPDSVINIRYSPEYVEFLFMKYK